MDVFIKNTKKKCSIIKRKKKKKVKMLLIVLLKKIICYVMISGAKASLPKMQNWDHSVPLHALDDYMHSVCSFLFKIFSLSLCLCLFFFVLFGFNDIQQGSNYTFKSNFHFFTRKWYNNYRKGVPFSLHETRGFV